MSAFSRWLKRRAGVPETRIGITLGAREYRMLREAFVDKATGLQVPGSVAGILLAWVLQKLGVEVGQ